MTEKMWVLVAAAGSGGLIGFGIAYLILNARLVTAIHQLNACYGVF